MRIQHSLQHVWAGRLTCINLPFVTAISQADETRNKLKDALLAGKVSHERVVAEARRYQPMINTLLLSCKVQPEMARLDGKVQVVDVMQNLTKSPIDLSIQ
jgi:hypothetical protein